MASTDTTTESVGSPGPGRGRAALVAGAAAFVVAMIPALVGAATRSTEHHGPVFPAEVAVYSWFTPHLSGAPGPVVMTYQNGVGVEALDLPQGIALSADGCTYRRFGAAEARSTPTDQGDPAHTLLSADGTFALIAGANREGSVELVSFVTGEAREIDVGEGRSALPLSIDAAGRLVVLQTDTDEMSPYLAFNTPMNGELWLLDLATGELRDLAVDGASGAAISPDGAQVAAVTAAGGVVLDLSTGERTDLPGVTAWADLEDDAWSPDGTALATLGREGGLQITSVTDEPQTRTLPLPPPADRYPSVLGWRDADTVMVQLVEGEANTAQFLWVSVSSGQTEVFSSYDSGWTKAALASADVARNLLASWDVRATRADQGPMLSLLLATGLGLLVAIVVAATWPRIRARVARWS